MRLDLGLSIADGGGALPPLVLSPSTASKAPLGSQTFTASGGSGNYSYSIFANNSGGSINASTGAYTAGNTGSVTDTVRVTDTSTGLHADSTVTISAGLSVSPATVTVAATLGTQTFTASGGSGTGYTYAITTNNSGGSINSSTGAYTAGSGSTTAVSDTITATDSLGNTGTAVVTVSAWQPTALAPDFIYDSDFYDGAGVFTDQSGNAKHTTPQVSPANPSLVANVKNGHAAARFTAVQGVLIPASVTYVGGAGAHSAEHALTCVLVCKTNASAADAAAIVLGAFAIYARLNAQAKWGCYAGGNRPSASYDDAAVKILGVTSPGSSAASTYYTTTAAATVTSESVAQGARNNAGGFLGCDTTASAHALNGDMFFAMAVNRILSAGEITSLVAYLSARYAI